MVSSILNNFLVNEVNPEKDVIRQAEESQKRLREILTAKLADDDTLPFVLEGQDFLFGSAIRGSQPAPFDDIDLMLVLDGSGLFAHEGGQFVGHAHGTGKSFNPLLLEQYLEPSGYVSSQKVLNKIRAVLDETYSRSELRKDNQAINVWMESYGFGIDVVPALKIEHTTAGVHYYIPFGTGSDMWKSTNPWTDIKPFKAEDQRLSGLLSAAAKLMRKWNELSNAKRLSGFHIDALVYRSLQGKNIQTLEAALRTCFQNFDALLATTCPQFSGFTPHIDHKLSDDERTQSRQAVLRAKNAISTVGLGGLVGTRDNTLGVWNKLFGEKLF